MMVRIEEAKKFARQPNLFKSNEVNLWMQSWTYLKDTWGTFHIPKEEWPAQLQPLLQDDRLIAIPSLSPEDAADNNVKAPILQ